VTITITAFERSPDGGKGLARDTRVRWALEEAGQSYQVRLVSFRAMKEPAHLALHPFGQIPTYEEGDLVLFETGAIVLHIAGRHGGLLPDDANARARAITWMFAAVNTVEPPILELQNAKLLEGDKVWTKEVHSDPNAGAPKKGGEDFGTKGVCETLSTMAGKAPTEMAQALLEASVAFRDGRPAGDDVSLLVVRYEGQQ